MKREHNTKRYGEIWPQYKIDKGLEILKILQQWIIVSGGWAWHFMSEENHIEYKHAHDHKDIDIFVHPENVAQVMLLLQENDFEKVWTRYDHIPSNENFRRYEKIDWLPKGKQYRVTIDFFEAKNIETIKVNNWTLVAPKTLLGFYSNIHASGNCWAVKKAFELLVNGKNLIGNPLLSKIP